jgi:hypothetical protein
MTQDDVIEMAQECNLIGMRPHLDGIYAEALVAFANLVADKATEEANAKANASWGLMCKKMVAIEREACAEIAGQGLIGHTIAKAIRARGEA